MLRLKNCCFVLVFVMVAAILKSCSAKKSKDDDILKYLNENNLLHGKAEIVFLLDRSGSVGAANFEIQKGFVESFLTHIIVDVNATRVAVISYSADAVRHIDYLQEPKTKCQLSQELQDVVFVDSGSTNIAAALDEARDVFRNARPNVNKVVILISDGLATEGGDPIPHADKLKNNGVQIFSFGIGKFLQNELASMASSARHVYSCNKFTEFKRLAKKIRGDPHESSWSGQTGTPNCNHLCDSPYKGEPNDPGCCDHSARCSCALLSGMHTCVCGPGYYGLSGLAGHCRACPKGTYKSKLEPKSNCEPCPTGSTTADVASTSIKDCHCKDGYHGDPTQGNPCEIVKCPPLQDPTHGFLLQDCRNTFGSTCVFMCKEGYELVDSNSDLRTCQSDGKWSGNTAICRKIICPYLRPPLYGRMRCEPGELKTGKRCQFGCSTGYVMSGSSTRTCLDTKQWSGEIAQCIPVECKIPQQPKYGYLFNCRTDTKPKFDETCVFKCFGGFKLHGEELLRCNEHGKLADNRGLEYKHSCEDTTPPEITCPEPLKVNTDKGKKTANVKWRLPYVRDNSGYDPEVRTVPKNVKPPVVFPIGVTKILYIATDRAGLESSCEVVIEVVDVQRPYAVKCPSKIRVSTGDVSAPVEWDEPIFVDNSKEMLKVIKNANSGMKFSMGAHTVTYTAFDRSGNSAQCVFDVIVTRSRCPYYPAPTNGAFTCEDWMYGQFCQAYCNEKHDFVEQPAEWYVCNSEARWSTIPNDLPVPWPDCATRSNPKQVRQMVSGFYYKGDCRNPQVQRYLKKLFLSHFESKFGRKYCQQENACKVDSVVVTCGEVTDEQVRRKKRDTGQPDERKLEIEITLNINQGLNDTEEVISEFLETIQNLDWDNIDNELEIEMSENLDPNSRKEDDAGKSHFVVTGGKTTLVCQPGSVISDNKCVLCSAGTYYSNATKTCLDCPIGHYQEEEGQMECEMCPEGMSTEYNRTRNETDCRGICLPGAYSTTGLETCLACHIGTYQENSGQKSCTTCPSGTTTGNIQSASADDCKVMCEPGSYSHDGLQPCIPCPKNYYQPNTGQLSCIECPNYLATSGTGAKNISECINYDPCSSDMRCENRGRCVRNGREASCECSSGFHGKFCENDVDECIEEQCSNNGKCKNVVGSYTCECNAGFTGKSCEEELDECASFPCQNNGTCLDKVNDYLCVCPSGYEGLNCEIQREICFRDIICRNGAECVNNAGETDSVCVCTSGYTGIDCSVNVNDCENVTCLNNGSCLDGRDTYTCSCAKGYTGNLCETEINECENNRCSLGSTCKDLVGDYECICPPGYSGRHCEIKLDSDFLMMFPESAATIGNLASVKVRSPLSEATVSMWIQTTDQVRSGTPLSYAVSDPHTNRLLDNALTLTDSSGVEIYVNNKPIVTNLQLTDGKWHHVAFTWSQNSGLWSLYNDGNEYSNGQNFQTNQTIPGGGVMVIGQEQDSIGGGFSPIETFTGNVTRVNVWGKYFSSIDVTRLYKLDDDIDGKIVAWPDFIPGVKGDVQLIEKEMPFNINF